jgi:hypothetical protein
MSADLKGMYPQRIISVMIPEQVVSFPSRHEWPVWSHIFRISHDWSGLHSSGIEALCNARSYDTHTRQKSRRPIC